MALWKIIILALIQGACELLPVSSSAHVIMAEKFMGLDPAAPEMTLLLVMLHTGTMFAVIVYFWPKWRSQYFSSIQNLLDVSRLLVLATGVTGAIGLSLMYFIEGIVLRGTAHAEIEQLFGNLFVISAGLAAVGTMIIVAGKTPPGSRLMGSRDAVWIGAIQGLCLPIRGFSRSGSTISMALLLGVERERAEEFSFALAVVLTPVLIVKEAYRLLKTQPDILTSGNQLLELIWPSLAGMTIAFVAGLGALQWLSRWLTGGHWKLFGYYCLFAAVAVVSFAIIVP
jgi:undecaprenyl-diphosphatase